jgi:photosystem II stability/assembly factor-like uncharacterized protein
LLLTSTTSGISSILMVSQNEGASWGVIAGARLFMSIAFCQTGDGWAVDGNGKIWATKDHGLTWTKLPTAPY